MSVESVLFYLFAAVACGGALGVVLAQNVVRMAFWLIVSLGSVAALFFLLNADFLGAAQLLIYVGGTVVLLVFGVMLTASGPYQQIRTSPAEMILGGGVGGLLLLLLTYSVAGADWTNLTTRLPEDPSVQLSLSSEGNTSRPLGLAFLGLRPRVGSTTERLPADLPGYLLPFEIVSVHLLVVLVGAAYLARAKRRVDPSAEDW